MLNILNDFFRFPIEGVCPFWFPFNRQIKIRDDSDENPDDPHTYFPKYTTITGKKIRIPRKDSSIWKRLDDGQVILVNREARVLHWTEKVAWNAWCIFCLPFEISSLYWFHVAVPLLYATLPAHGLYLVLTEIYQFPRQRRMLQDIKKNGHLTKGLMILTDDDSNKDLQPRRYTVEYSYESENYWFSNYDPHGFNISAVKNTDGFRYYEPEFDVGEDDSNCTVGIPVSFFIYQPPGEHLYNVISLSRMQEVEARAALTWRSPLRLLLGLLSTCTSIGFVLNRLGILLANFTLGDIYIFNRINPKDLILSTIRTRVGEMMMLAGAHLEVVTKCLFMCAFHSHTACPHQKESSESESTINTTEMHGERDEEVPVYELR